MWLMKLANPFVGLILRSPLHRLFSGALLLLTYRGRKTGKQYTLPVQFAQQGDEVLIVPGGAEKKTWWRNLRGGAPVTLYLAGQERKGLATLLEGPADREALSEGFIQYLQRFPAAAKFHNLERTPEGSFRPEDVTAAVDDLVLVRIQLN